MYTKIIIDAINYIKDNLEEKLTVEDIANHCHFSKYHLITDPSRCMTDLCITTTKKIDDDCNTQIIKGGNYAIYHFEDPDSDLFGTYQGLMGQWMPRSSLRFDLNNRKIFSIIRHYDTPNDFYCFDILVPFI